MERDIPHGAVKVLQSSLLIALLTGGCATSESNVLSEDSKWRDADRLKGWTVATEVDLVKKAHLKRHPRHDSYVPVSETKRLTESEAEIYEALNDKLHNEINRVSKEHFENTEVPPELQKDDLPYFTPFTYQNYDWYGPSYECYVAVIDEYITVDLLRKYQALLVGDHGNWCIQVVLSEGPDFDNNGEIALFSDQVIVPMRVAKQLQIAPPNESEERSAFSK